jgi:hypothetical protein
MSTKQRLHERALESRRLRAEAAAKAQNQPQPRPQQQSKPAPKSRKGLLDPDLGDWLWSFDNL